jgi:nicotinate-nucleotide pyrophosphorylase (carboxylating)
MHKLSQDEIRLLVRRAIEEDVGPGDVTTLATVPSESRARAVMIARERAVIAGLEFAQISFKELDPGMQMILGTTSDGQQVGPGTRLMTINGKARAILTAERVALNFVQRLSGVATLTAKFVDAIKGTNTQILDTRKTTPGLRRAEKYAVACGGGQNHRLGLFDLVLIKDNHLAALRDAIPNAIAAAVERARDRYPKLKVEVEADTLEQVGQALAAGADFILLDNMNVEQLRRAVELVDGRAKTEASGGVNLSTVRPIAETGVDFISVGALTHSAPAVDIALDFEL